MARHQLSVLTRAVVIKCPPAVPIVINRTLPLNTTISTTIQQFISATSTISLLTLYRHKQIIFYTCNFSVA